MKKAIEDQTNDVKRTNTHQTYKDPKPDPDLYKREHPELNEEDDDDEMEGVDPKKQEEMQMPDMETDEHDRRENEEVESI
jgi:hypothetical protein